MKKIFISPSNQIENKYAYGNTNEGVVCRQIAEKLSIALKRCGFSTNTDTKNNMYAKVKNSDNWGADLHVCIHTNAFNGKVRGTRLFAFNSTGEGMKASKCVYNVLAPYTPGESDNITVNNELYEIRYTNAPCVYIECEFHDNVESAKWILNNIENIAEKIAEGLCNYYNVTYKTNNTLYRVQVGAFAVKENAEKMRDKMLKMGYSCFIVKS